jgi:hypothetical protein
MVGTVNKRTISTLFSLTLAVSHQTLANGAKTPVSTQESSPPKVNAVANQYLVAFKDDAAAQTRVEVFARLGIKEIERVGTSQLYLIEVPAGDTQAAKLAELKSSQGVRYVEPNLKMRIMK